MDISKKTINVLGDSITEASYLDDENKRFTNIIAKELLCKVNNYGIGGTCISPYTISEDPRWDMDFISRVDDMTDDADIVIVFGGTNDYGHGVCRLGNMNDRDNKSFYGCLHILYQSLIKKYLGKEIIICTPLHRYNEVKINKTPERGEGSDELINYVKAIREVCEYYGLPVIDLYKDSGIQPAFDDERDYFTVDGLHPSENGHRRIANRIERFLREL